MSDLITRYNSPARILHWVMALLVLMMIPAGVVMVQEGLDRSLQNTLFIFHKNVGTLLLLLIIARIAYRRLRPPPPLPDTGPGVATQDCRCDPYGAVWSFGRDAAAGIHPRESRRFSD